MPIFTEPILLPMKRIFWVLTTVIILAGCKEKDSRFAAAFTENFDGPKVYLLYGNGLDEI